MPAKERKKNIVSPIFQIILIIIVTVILSIAVYITANKFSFTESAPKLIILTPAKLNEFGDQQSTINIGLYVNDFPEFNVIKNEFIFSGVIWFKFDPTAISLDTIGKFTFDKGEIQEKSAPYTQIIDDKLFARYNIKVKFTTDLKYSKFPLDNHSIFIVLDNKFLTPSDAIFESGKRDFIVTADMKDAGWNELDRSVDTGITQLVLEEYDKQTNIYNLRTIFRIDYLRSDIKYFISIFLPLILIFFLTLFTFSLDPNVYDPATSLALTSGGITGMIAFKFVIESMSPQVGYFMLSDYLYFLFFIAVMLIFFFDMVLEKLKLNPYYIVVGLQICVLTASIYLLWGLS